MIGQKVPTFLRLFFVFMMTGLSVIFFTTLLLYSSAIDGETQKLKALSQTHAKLLEAVTVRSRLIDAVNEYRDSQKEAYTQGRLRGVTLDQISQVHFEVTGFGETGEFVLAEEHDGRIHFLVPTRGQGSIAASVDVGGTYAEPMQRALMGSSGFMVGSDYQGNNVFAWYEPVPVLNAGFVAKIDAWEIRKPYVVSALWGGMIVLVAAAIATLIFLRVEAQSILLASGSIDKGQQSKQRKSLYLAMILCLVTVGTIAVVAVGGLIYSHEVEHRKSELAGLTKGVASLIDSVASIDEGESKVIKNYTEGNAATIFQIKDIMKNASGFGQTGEVVLGIVPENQIEFLLPSRFTGVPPAQVSLESDVAEPMRRALAGESGVIESIDYRGELVVAAFHHVKHLGGGIVAKMDVNEIQKSYLIIGSINVSLAIFFVVFAVLLAPQLIEGINKTEEDDHWITSSSGPESGAGSFQENLSLGVIIGMCGFLFLLDIKTPIGLAIGIPYIGLIIIGSFIVDKAGLILLAGFATILVLAGLAFVPEQEVISWQVATNRIYPVLTIWLAVIILLRIKNTELFLRQSEHNLTHILESMPDPTIAIREEGNILFVSEQAEKFFGYEKAQLLGRSIEMILPNAIMGKYAGLGTGFFESHTNELITEEGGLFAVNNAGVEIAVEISLSPVKTSDGTLVIAIIRDITERISREKSLAHYAKELERSNEELQHFAYAASHDLQEPLRKIQAFSERLTENCAESLDERGTGYLDRIVRSATRMRGLIDDLLAFSRIAAQNKPYVPVDLGDIVNAVLDDLETTIGQVSAKINVGTLPTINGDPTQMRQMLQNLISNAIKFKRDDAPLVIDIKSKTVFEGICLTVCDNGIGFEPKFATRIFELFERLHGRDAYPGTGIGLATCRKIIERHDGSISAHGNPGEGAIFTIILPVNQFEGIH